MAAVVVPSCFRLVLVAEAYSVVASAPVSLVGGTGRQRVSRVVGGLVGVLLGFLF